MFTSFYISLSIRWRSYGKSSLSLVMFVANACNLVVLLSWFGLIQTYLYTLPLYLTDHTFIPCKECHVFLFTSGNLFTTFFRVSPMICMDEIYALNAFVTAAWIMFVRNDFFTWHIASFFYC